MADRIDLPPNLQGDEKAQLQQLWSYLYQMSQALNNNLDAIGGNELTDSERSVMQKILSGDEVNSGLSEMETLKSLIIKTADFVQTSLTEYRMNLLGSTVASGQFGRYVRNTGLDVEVNPEGITQNYSFQEIVQGLKHYEINAKNYIKTGLLRTVSSIPVYGVAIGKDVVTFDENGNETYVDGNKVAELTADELSFWQNGVKVAGYTGNRISFYYNGTECFYIQNGKMYAAADFEINSGKKLIIASGADLEVASGGDLNIKSGGNLKVSSGGGIDIRGSGTLALTGSTVSIKSNSTFDVDSENIIINSGRGNFITKSYFSAIQDYLRFSVGNTPIGNMNYSAQITPVASSYLNNSTWITTYPVQLQVIDKVSYTGMEMVASMLIGQLFRTDASDGQNKYLLGMDLAASREVNGSYVETRDAHFFADVISCRKYLKANNLNATTGYIDTLSYRIINQSSSKEIKHDIQPLEPMGEKLDRLQPVTFVYDDDAKEAQRMGLIYEDTMEVMPEVCTGDESDKAISYVELIPALLKEIQELRARVKALEEREE